jgi:hypothetical protein
MLEFMHDGGMLMWPLLTLALIAIGMAARQAISGGEGAIDPTRLARAVLAGGIGWCCMGIVVTLGHARDSVPFEIYLKGISESLAPAVLGLLSYAVVGVIASLAPRGRLSGPGQA